MIDDMTSGKQASTVSSNFLVSLQTETTHTIISQEDQLEKNSRAVIQETADALATNLSRLSTPAISRSTQKPKQYFTRAHDAAVVLFLVISGISLTVLTHGLAAPEGAALLTEAFQKLDEFSNQDALKKELDDYNKAKTTLQIFAEHHICDEIEKFNHQWIRSIINHCEAQKKLLLKIVEILNEQSVKTNEAIQIINTLLIKYDEKIFHIKQLENTLLQKTAEKQKPQTELQPTISDQIKKIAKDIIEFEEKKSEFLLSLSPIKNNKAVKHVNTFKNQTHLFFEKYKKMIHIAGLLALTAAGIALIIGTGGIAAALGIAALATIGIDSAKTVVLVAKEKLKDDHAGFILEKNRISAHITQQSHTSTLPENIRTHYQKQKERLVTLNAAQHSFWELHNVAQSVERIDQTAINSKKISGAMLSTFKRNVKNFAAENKGLTKKAIQITIGITAFVALGILTGGATTGIAIGAAIIASLISPAISMNLKKFMLYNKEEKEGEGKKCLV